MHDTGHFEFEFFVSFSHDFMLSNLDKILVLTFQVQGSSQIATFNFNMGCPPAGFALKYDTPNPRTVSRVLGETGTAL